MAQYERWRTYLVVYHLVSHAPWKPHAHFVPAYPGILFRNSDFHNPASDALPTSCNGIVVPTYSAEEYLRMHWRQDGQPLCAATALTFQRAQNIDPTPWPGCGRILKIGERNHLLISVAPPGLTKKNI